MYVIEKCFLPFFFSFSIDSEKNKSFQTHCFQNIHSCSDHCKPRLPWSPINRWALGHDEMNCWLWEQVFHRTRYKLNISKSSLIRRLVKCIPAIEILTKLTNKRNMLSFHLHPLTSSGFIIHVIFILFIFSNIFITAQNNRR